MWVYFHLEYDIAQWNRWLCVSVRFACDINHRLSPCSHLISSSHDHCHLRITIIIAVFVVVVITVVIVIQSSSLSLSSAPLLRCGPIRRFCSCHRLHPPSPLRSPPPPRHPTRHHHHQHHPQHHNHHHHHHHHKFAGVVLFYLSSHQYCALSSHRQRRRRCHHRCHHQCHRPCVVFVFSTPVWNCCAQGLYSACVQWVPGGLAFSDVPGVANIRHAHP